MTRKRILYGLLALVGICAVTAVAIYFYARQQINFAGGRGDAQIADISLPDGFAIQVFAEGLRGPRFMAVGPDSVLYVADRGNDRIVALPDANGDGQADEIRVVAEGLNNPHNLIFHEGSWYVAVTEGVVRLNDSDGDGVAESFTTLLDTFLPPGQHSSRTIAFLPDGRLLISAGSTCNVCEEEDPRRAAITVYDSPVGQDQLTGEQIYASGLRNAVGLTIHPETGQLWVTNNGRDLLGDDLPPETVYSVTEGGDYGWPSCHSGTVVDPEFGFDGACAVAGKPVVTIQAHSAPLGLTFYTGDAFPAEYQGDLFVALHGSWNRSVPTGYKIVRVPLDGSIATGPVEDFATGWLNEADYSSNGRPVGVTVGADGALYVSDDKGGYIYRIYAEP
ncbi:MAG: sorbosone dehydrogenase family protein [Ardenticatenaceae bacterium]|nr:sorbosone dehydrogenase family protein [Anaerolineales bacterium]MCB8941757.1 sorbosone dehydrogenase family protein [Ardenticatenaceae bacterium]MCB8972868.1 sorbosone dehydrogenase family protein [Ardenticatenaceae bacterium]